MSEEKKELKVKKVFDKPTEIIEEETTTVTETKHESNPKEAQD